MATLSAAMVTLLTDNWAGAGAAPTFGALIDFQKDLAVTTEQVLVRLPIHEDVDPINNIYSNFKFTMQIRIKSTVSEDRLKVLTDETIRIINTYAITGITRQFAKRGENTSDRKRQVFSYDVWAICEEHMSTGGTSYSSPGAGDVTMPADLTVTDDFGFDTGETVDVILDEDDMASDDEDALATQQSIKAYVDAVSLDDLSDVTISDQHDFEVLGLDDDAEWKNLNLVTELGMIQNVVQDLSPQLGADLDCQGHDVDFTVVGGSNIKFPTTNITDCLDEDNMATDSATKLCTQQSIKAYCDAHLMIGSANAAWVPLAMWGALTAANIRVTNSYLQNITVNNIGFDMLLPIPCLKGSLKLYLKSLKYGIVDADADDYLDDVTIYGLNGNARTQLDIDNTVHNSVGDKTFSGAVMPASVIDVSSYQNIYVSFDCINADIAQFDISNIRMECYYAA